MNKSSTLWGTAFVILYMMLSLLLYCIICLIIKYIKFKFTCIELVYEVRRNQ